MFRPQRMTLASVILVVTPCPGGVPVFLRPWTCPSAFGGRFARRARWGDFTRRYRGEDRICEVQRQGDAQEGVEG